MIHTNKDSIRQQQTGNATSQVEDASQIQVKPHRRYVSYLLAFVLVITLGGWMASGILSAPEPTLPDNATQREQLALSPTLVSVENAYIEEVSEVIEVSGKTAASRTITLKSTATGRIVALGVGKGDQVQSDQPMVRLDAGELTSNIAKAQAQVRENQVNYDSMISLQSQNLASAIEVLRADAQLQTAKAALEEANEAMKDTSIRAPFAAIVTDQMVEIGDFVTPGSPLFVLADISPTLISASLSEQELAKLGNQRPEALVELATGERYFGQLTYIAPAAEPTSNTFDIEITLEKNTDARVRLGVTSKVKINLEPVRALRIRPSQLLLSANGELAVRVVDSQNRVASFAVDALRSQANFIWVEGEGINESLQIVVSGAGFVEDGDQVQTRNIALSNEEEMIN